MRLNSLKAIVKTAVRGASVLLLGAGVASAQQQINLTAGSSTTILPDGSSVPMWGYSCGTAVAGSTATCAKLNTGATGWSPVVLTVPANTAGTTSLTINLTNNLVFTAGTGTNGVPTSLMIVGQLGGGLGTPGGFTDPPDHTKSQTVTWPIADPGTAGTAPTQGSRVQSFGTEVAAVPVGSTTPPTALTWANLKPGTYLFESGTHPSIQGPMGLYGILVVTTAPAGATAGTAYPVGGTGSPVNYNAELPLLLSEIDPVQNNAVAAAVATMGFSETTVWSGQPGGCGNPSSSTYHQCYPPAVDYTPLYYMINGVAFNKTSASSSLFATSPATGVTGTVLVRLVNAGLRMHVPSIVGAQTGTPAKPGFSLIAEDGNPLPGLARVQSEVFMAAGKTYDVMVNVPAAGSTALPVFDRELSLSGNAVGHDTGMFGYIGVNGAALPGASGLGTAVARADTYSSLVPGKALTVTDPAKGVITNDTNVYGVQLLTAPAGGTVVLNPDGTFKYTPNAGTTADSFTYCANGAVSGGVCASGISAAVTLGAATADSAAGITCGPSTFQSNSANFIAVKTPGVLAKCTDSAGYPLTVDPTSVTASGINVIADANGGFVATTTSATTTAASTATFTFKAKSSYGTLSAATTVTINFLAGSGLKVTVLDGNDKTTHITDYRWIIEEDRTFYVDPNCTTNPPPAACQTVTSTANTLLVPTFGTNFHTSYMPVVATGCTGPVSCESGQSIAGSSVVCDVGNGFCRTGASRQAVDPGQVALDPKKRYYITVLPGDAANPFEGADIGHGMGGAPIPFACPPTAPAGVTPTCSTTPPPVTILTQPTPLQTAKLSVFVFEDDFPLNGENDAGGQVADNQLGTQEPGLGGFNITLFDDAGGTGDATGQMTYDMFNMPLSNSLDGTIDPATGLNACPIAKAAAPGSDPAAAAVSGMTGTIVTCPKYESDGTTQSPLAGQAVVANMMPGRYGVVATPGADRIGRGEEWLQTNTLDGQKAHDSFLRVGEPSFFQEYGPASYHVVIGFANPKIINARKAAICSPGGDPIFGLSGTNCTNSVTGLVTTERMSRTPDERLYSSGTNDSFGFTQCYISFGDADGEDFAFTKCNSDGSFTLSGLPDGDWRITVFDQWNDMLVDGLSTPVRLGGGATTDLGQIATNQWQANLYTSTFFDQNKDGVRQSNEPGLSLVVTNIRFRDGSFSNFNSTDLNGNAGFNEVFPLFNWYVVETDSTRYKNTGTHVVYDAGGPADGTCTSATAPCGSSSIAANMANSYEAVPVPGNLHVPGAIYCNNGDCTGQSIQNAPNTASTPNSTARIDPPWVVSEGWQGFSGQNSFLEFGKTPYTPGETGGIHGHVIYASTRPFDDPQLLLQTSWMPEVPNVTVNLYKESTAPDGSTALSLIDTTKTSSFDDWAQGFRSDGIPNMNCPGQGRDTGPKADLFFFSLFDQPNYLDLYNSLHGGPAYTQLPNDSQFKCYDGMHNWNQLQPAPYDGMYSFPSITSIDPVTGKPAGSNCSGCTTNPDATDSYRFGTPMLPAGKYVVEVVVPPGYELVKEEDKNILIGDNYIAPVAQEFGGLSNIFILPDQAEVGATYNANNPEMPNTDQGRTTFPTKESDTGSVETFWPCVGEARVVPDYISLFPQSQEVAPFAGATRNLCDRKEVTLDDQSAALAKFYLFTSAHGAAHLTGIITDDFTSEFDPFAPSFGEKFSPPDMPVSIKDWAGNEISRIYADHWGAYDGLTYSTWEVNPPNPTGYAPQMMVTCMNDPGTGPTPDPLYNPQYSDFCYELPFMPGQTAYLDTPVTPTSAFAGAGYNNPDCAYPDATPAVSEVDGDGVGPWVSASGHTITIHALGDQLVPNNAYSGPSATTGPYNQKTVTRHYGFGATQGTGSVAIGVNASGVPIPATVTSWSDTQITVTVPTGVPNCAVQQQIQYSGLAATATAQCGELVITAGNGKQSIDSVTVTIGGKAPTHVAASASIQTAIDAAKPGDLIIIDPTCTSATGPVACSTAGATHSNSVHSELLLMWKPVRLQGVGAASSIIDGNTHPAGKLDPWRQKVNCLFGLGPAGTHNTWSTGCATALFGGSVFGFTASANNPQVDRLPLEAVVGWDATLNGNLAQLLQEPTLMGALEGAAITVLGKGVRFPSDPFVADTFPVGTLLLLGTTNATRGCGLNTATAHNPFPSNFLCNPSSIDGLGIRDSSQGGGGIFVHGWGHNLQIANDRVNNNSGTLSGGINVGQGEFPPAYLGGIGTVNADPGSCQTSLVTNLQLPYCHNLNVNVHHNSITSNSSTGDELFSATPAGAGGISFCTGADFYKFQYNWVCGNLSTGDGGGFGHIGFSYNGLVQHNTFLFNQSTNPTIQANGGGLIIMGAPDADPACPAVADTDCQVPPNAVTPSDGIGPLLTIDANLIMGNSADSGSGGGIALQNVNGGDVVSFPTTPSRWNHVVLTNNIIANNVAGWDGAGLSLVDALNTDIVNNTIVSNDTTASSGILFNTIGAPLASAEGTNCTQPGAPTTSCPQPAGLVSVQNSSILNANLPGSITCPAGHFSGTTATNGTCRTFSYPLLDNNVLWQNRAFYIGVGALGGGTLNQQNVVALYDAFTTTPAPSQPQADGTTANGNGTIITGGTGACTTPASYWDIGVRGDSSPTVHSSTVTLNPTYSVMTSIAGYSTTNTLANPTLLLQYCNGSRIPPELGTAGYQVPPGISDATVPNPIFSLTPAATVDEGNNWINMSWGPLSLSNPVTSEGLSNYGPAAGSSVINYILSTATANFAAAPSTDFYGNPRKANNAVDAGAVEFLSTAAAPTLTSISPNSGLRGTAVPVTLTGTNLTGAFLINVTGTGVTVSNLVVVSATSVTATFTIATAALTTARNVTVSTPGGVSNAVTFTVTAPPLPTLTSIAPTSGARGTSVNVTFTGTNLTGAFAVTGVGALIPVTNLTVVSPTTVTATLNITRAAPLGIRNLGLTTPGGTSNTRPFTVTGGTPAFTGPTPALTTTVANGTTKNGTVTLTNSATGANAGPIRLTAAPVVNRVTGTGAFTVTGGTCASGTVLAPGGSCTIAVRYVPPTTGSLTSTAHVTISDTGVATANQNSPNFTAN